MNKQSNKPYPIRLGIKQAFLMEEAYDKDRSLHYLINKILEKHLDECGDIRWREAKALYLKSKRTS